MSYGLIAVIIVIGIVIGAIATKKCEPFLIGGSIIGAIFLYKQDFITEWVNTLEGVMSDEAYLILVCGLFGSIIALLTASKGHFGFAKIVSKICNSERKTLFTTFILGVIIFIDDYLNVLSIGTAMKKVYDKVKVPREALALQVHQSVLCSHSHLGQHILELSSSHRRVFRHLVQRPGWELILKQFHFVYIQ